jgi:hypothetical protein
LDNTSPRPSLPFLDNWLAYNDALTHLGAVEYPLYSDAEIAGPLTQKFGPYTFSNTMLRRTAAGEARMPIILRLGMHAPTVSPDLSKKNDTRYHGGDMPDEIAALSSLCMGVRLRAGAGSRRFEFGDQYGIPGQWDSRATPTLGSFGERLILPHVLHGSLENLRRLDALPLFSDATAVALVRAARLYQDALWIAESEPALAWLMFVSALETAANHWRADNGTVVERFTHHKPKLVSELHEIGGDALVASVAEHIEPTLGATNKFLKFVLEYLPDPPEDSVRPAAAAARISWDPKSMKNLLRLVYSYRSGALHGGNPMPAPMCKAPFRFGNGEMTEVGIIGSAVSSKGGVWTASDVPINLHTFHYIARGALLRWWDTMAAAATS